MNGALDGIRVLDASQMLAGPICAMRLGDLGADVLKIEPPRGEHNRHNGFGAVRVRARRPPSWASIATSAASPSTSSSRAGLAALLALVERSGRVPAELPCRDRGAPGYRLGATAEPSTRGWSMPRSPATARTVPWRDRPGQDLLVQAMSGSMWSVGPADDAPQPGALWAADAMTGYQAAIGILAALQARERTGEGQKVSVSMLGCDHGLPGPGARDPPQQRRHLRADARNPRRTAGSRRHTASSERAIPGWSWPWRRWSRWARPSMSRGSPRSPTTTTASPPRRDPRHRGPSPGRTHDRRVDRVLRRAAFVVRSGGDATTTSSRIHR